MPKKALVLNGFGGGINKDSDATDLPAEGRGKDQVVTLTNMLADLGGKTYLSSYKFVAGGIAADSNNTSGTDDLLIYNNTYYQNTGLYKIGGDVNWSGNIIQSKPPAISHYPGQGATVNVNPTFTTRDLTYVFMGGGASLSTSNNAIIGDIERTTNYRVHDFIRPALDHDQDANWGDNDTVTDFDTFGGLGLMPNLYNGANISTGGGGSDYTIVSTGGSSPHLTHVNSTGLKILDGVSHGASASEHRYFKSAPSTDLTIWKYHTVRISIKITGTIGTNGNVRITLYCGSTKLKDCDITSAGIHEFTYSHGSSADLTDKIFFRVGEGNPVDTVGTGDGDDFVYLNHAKVYWYGGDGDGDNEHRHNVRAFFSDGAGAHIDTYNGDFSNVSHTDQAYDVTGASYLSLDKHLNNDDHVACIFRVGNHTVNGTDIDGIFGAGLDVKGKDMYLELQLFPDGASHYDSTSVIQKLVITLNEDNADYSLGVVGDKSKIYEITGPNLSAEGAFNDKVRIKIPADTATSTGPTMDETNICLIAIGLIVDNNYSSFNTTVMNLYELSFSEPSAIGWSQSKIQLSQTDTRNSSSSLPSNYTSTVSAGEKNTLSLDIYKPTTAGYKGKVYYQTVDSQDGISTNSRFLLAEVDKDKGVRKVESNVFTKWASNKVNLTFDSTPFNSTFEFESGYPDGTMNINALWNTASTNGRQVYVGSVLSPGVNIELAFLSLGSSNCLTNYGANWEDIGFLDGQIVKISGSLYNDGSYKIDGISGVTLTLQTEAGTTYTPTAEVTYVSIGVEDTDRILKAPPGKLYGFPDKNFIDLELGAGAIKVMETAGDRLLVFSEDNLTIVNIAQDYEYLEASMPGYGIENKRQIAKVSEGVAFVNAAGVFFFDGNTVNNISDNALDTENWSSASSLTYDPSEKLIMAWVADNDNEVYCYSLKTKAWVGMLTNVMFTDDKRPQTNSVNYKGSMYVVDNNTTNALVKLGTDTATSRSITLETGRISCGNLAMEKSFKYLYVTTKTNTGSLDVDWDIDNAGYTSSPVSITGSGRVKVPIKGKGKDIQFKFTGTPATDFEISDIQLIYRDKRVK